MRNTRIRCTRRYVLAPDARAAIRAGSAAAASAAAKRKASARGDAGRAALLNAGWGDEEALQTSALNPNYDPEVYAEYPANVRKNLARLNEDVLDLDFVEELISWADEQTPLPGAILVFLPGMGEISALMERLGSSSRCAAFCYAIFGCFVLVLGLRVAACSIKESLGSK